MERNEDPSKKDGKVHETVCVFWWRGVYFGFIGFFTRSMQNKQAKVRICPQCGSGIPVFWSRSLCIPCTRSQEQSQKEVKKLTQAAIKVAHIGAAKASELAESKTEGKPQSKSQNARLQTGGVKSRRKRTKSSGKKQK
ncbi:MAG: hypothetical protein HG424_003630 [candidate division SR1 bacterium]|nr:hypothetical protein [candidate division SR1 bacterium]